MRRTTVFFTMRGFWEVKGVEFVGGVIEVSTVGRLV
jgi:hypothetical protein